LATIGGAAITIGIIEIVGLIFSMVSATDFQVMFRKIAAKENAQSALLNEAWRINRYLAFNIEPRFNTATKTTNMFKHLYYGP
jgi:hypothetical protein